MENNWLDKVILVHYINVGTVTPMKARERIHAYRDELRRINDEHGVSDKMITYILPVRDQDTRIECVYPNFRYPDGDFERLKAELDKIGFPVKDKD